MTICRTLILRKRMRSTLRRWTEWNNIGKIGDDIVLFHTRYEVLLIHGTMYIDMMQLQLYQPW